MTSKNRPASDPQPSARPSASEPARDESRPPADGPNPPEANLPREHRPIEEPPGHLKARADAFKRRRGVTR